MNPDENYKKYTMKDIMDIDNKLKKLEAGVFMKASTNTNRGRIYDLPK